MEKVVIVIGAAGGLGSEIARRFGTNRAKVVLSDIPKAQNAMEKLSQEINKGSGQSFTYQADVRSYEELKGMVEETLRKWGRIDAVVNAVGGPLSMLKFYEQLSGVLTERSSPTKKDNKLLVDHSEEDWDLVVDVNLKGSFNCIRAVAPQMIKQRDGHIILISSGTGIRPGKLMSSYAAAKAGILGLMKAAARELGEYNIKVNAVNPGLITHRLLPLSEVTHEGYLSDTMLGRLSNPEDFADFVVYLSQKDNISGQIFHLDSRVLV